ncbi:UNVERIFIED_CONTAM: hypothetical protein Slati_4220200 [Sesamum latifolium]|uniref:RNase H type-1 domain-containing protein n=1 Tax=Sesamum latifolium TaxID=2727402 RepID=A0AAW2TBK0_9LAMI
MLRADHWQGDLHVSSRFGFFFVRPAPPKPKLVGWGCSDLDWFKMNCDDAAKTNPSAAGARGLLRDHEGKLLFAYYKFLGDKTNIFAEFAAVAHGLELSSEKGFQQFGGARCSCCHRNNSRRVGLGMFILAY